MPRDELLYVIRYIIIHNNCTTPRVDLTGEDNRIVIILLNSLRYICRADYPQVLIVDACIIKKSFMVFECAKYSKSDHGDDDILL